MQSAFNSTHREKLYADFLIGAKAYIRFYWPQINIRSQAGCKYTPVMGYEMKPSSKPLHSPLSRVIDERMEEEI